ncbi:LytR/AlgR family response regulator transcription factor [Dyella terrae]|uniref:LytR/AlgR family response regulator transcription factor n=1 Tax=Dyella terrae TaxID=522259 RepID=UPI001EFE0720|nr:LytTR family DNA-binding domain-containing protein [Dyella terrae]ULU25816.1 LytTR family DNA-binding domain-containing protein [Dyella terrae]
MIRALIIDDEPLARRGVRVCLRRAADVVVVGEAESGMVGLRMIETLRPDVVFLDIQMPAMDGFALLSAIDGDKPPLVVFLTAHDSYALQAFGVHAVDYVMKPIDDGRFDDALCAVRQRVRERQAHTSQVAVPGHELAAWDARLEAKRGGRTVWIGVDEIDWIQASGDYVTLHAGARLHMIHESMEGMERRLDPRRFARIHRSTIVAVDRVQGFSLLPTRDALVTLKGGAALRVSRRFRHRISLDGLCRL